MSRVGKKAVPVPDGVTVEARDGRVVVKGKLGENTWLLPDGIAVDVEANEVRVSRASDQKQLRALHGTTRSLIANMIEGVSAGFKKELEVSGVGYRAQVQGNKIVLNVGVAHPIEYELPEGVQAEVKDGTNITVTGIDKQLVGLAGARIRGFSKAEPYKGKGIKYKGEQIRRKVGKTVS